MDGTLKDLKVVDIDEHTGYVSDAELKKLVESERLNEDGFTEQSEDEDWLDEIEDNLHSSFERFFDTLLKRDEKGEPVTYSLKKQNKKTASVLVKVGPDKKTDAAEELEKTEISAELYEKEQGYISSTRKEDAQVIEVYTEEDSHKPSPFMYHRNSSILFEEKRKKTVLSSMRELLEKRLLNSDGCTIIDFLNKYKYLNAHMIYELFKAEKECPETYVKNILAKLLDFGMVTRFKISYRDISHNILRTSFIYTFSDKVDNIFSFKTNKTKKEAPARSDFSSPEVILRRLAFNQFLIHIKQKYGSCLYECTNGFSESFDNVDGKLTFKSGGKFLTMNLITLRDTPDWKKDLLKVLAKYAQETKALFLVLVESEPFALAIEKYRKELDGINKQIFCYLCDYASHDESLLLSYVLHVSDETCTSYNICSFPVD